MFILSAMSRFCDSELSHAAASLIEALTVERSVMCTLMCNYFAINCARVIYLTNCFFFYPLEEAGATIQPLNMCINIIHF